MLERDAVRESVADALRRNRVVSLLGPRQCGKTTLARQFLSPESANYFDLEDPESRARLREPKTALEPLHGLVVIDEVQRHPELFPLLRVLADRHPNPARFLILGSASPALLRQSSESLAGRMETIELTPFRLAEVGTGSWARHWQRGGFPLSYLAESERDSWLWRKSFLSAFLERDLPLFGVGVAPAALARFWSMLAHYHGQIWNASEIAGSLDVASVTTKRYLDILSATFMIRQLQPWHENLRKRQVKAPKIYFRDSGLFHCLLGVRSENDLLKHPKLGASWEGYAIEEVIRQEAPDEAYFWATHGGAELDLLMFRNGRRIGVECKRTDAPKMTVSMRAALQDLRLDELRVVYPGSRSYHLADAVSVHPLASLVSLAAAGPP